MFDRSAPFLLTALAIACASDPAADTGTGMDAGPVDRAPPADTGPIDEDATTEDALPEDAEPADTGMMETTARLLLEVIDVDGDPIRGATIDIGGISAISDESGTADMVLPLGTLVGTVHAAAHAPVSFTASFFAGDVRQQTAILNPYRTTKIFQAEAGATITSGFSNVIIAPNSLVDGTGNPVTGDVVARVVFVDPLDAFGLSGMPGPLHGVRTGTPGLQLLETYGMIDVTITQNDRPLNLAPGMTARLELGVPWSHYNHPQRPEVPSWSFDLQAGIWREEGMGNFEFKGFPTGSGTIYRGAWITDISHLSWWNADFPGGRGGGGGGGGGGMMGPGCVVVRALDSMGRPIEGALVDLGSAYQPTTSPRGTACELVPRNRSVNVTITAPGFQKFDRAVAIPDPVARCDSPESGPSCVVLEAHMVRADRCIKGRVVDETNLAVPGVRVAGRVIAEDGSRTRLVQRSVTQANGEYCLPAADGFFMDVTAANFDGTRYFVGKVRAPKPRMRATCSMGMCEAVPPLTLRAVTSQAGISGYAQMTRGFMTAGASKPAPQGLPVWIYEAETFVTPDCATSADPTAWGVLLGTGTIRSGGDFCVDIPVPDDVSVSNPFEVVAIAGDCDIAEGFDSGAGQVIRPNELCGSPDLTHVTTGFRQKAIDFHVAGRRIGDPVMEENPLLIVGRPYVISATFMQSDSNFGGSFAVEISANGAPLATHRELRVPEMPNDMFCQPLDIRNLVHAPEPDANTEIRLKVDPDDEYFETNEGNNEVIIRPQVYPSPVELIQIVPVQESGREPLISASHPRFESRLQAIYPFADASLTVEARPASFVYTSTVTGRHLCSPTNTRSVYELLGQLCTARTNEGYTGRFYGILPIARDPTCIPLAQTEQSVLGAADVPGVVAAGWDVENASATDAFWVFAHEYGHTINLFHAPCRAPLNTIDANYPEPDGVLDDFCFWHSELGNVIEDRVQFTDVMGYCDNPWMSQYQYHKAFNALSTSPQSTCAGALHGSRRGDSLLISGTIEDGRVQLAPVHRLMRASLNPPPGDHAIVFETPSGEKRLPFIAAEAEVEDLGRHIARFGFTMPAGDVSPFRIERGREILARFEAREAAAPIYSVEEREGALSVRWDHRRHPYLMVTALSGDRAHTLVTSATGGFIELPLGNLRGALRFELSFSTGTSAVAREHPPAR